jgi:hypothetical protein
LSFELLSKLGSAGRSNLAWTEKSIDRLRRWAASWDFTSNG